MKLVLIILLFPSIVFGQTVKFVVYEGMWSQPLEGAVVTVQSDSTKNTYISDKKGVVTFEKNHLTNQVTISHATVNYKSRIFVLDSTFNEKKPFYLYPTPEYESYFPETRPLQKMKEDVDNSKTDLTIIDDLEHTFDGGYNAMKDFLKNNTIYPIEAIQNKWEGRTSLGFLCEKDGKVTKVTIRKSSGFEILDDEAKRVMRSSPKWIAPKINGQFIRSYLSLPITFKLD